MLKKPILAAGFILACALAAGSQSEGIRRLSYGDLTAGELFFAQVHADFDGDGILDLFRAAGKWQSKQRQHVELWLGKADGTLQWDDDILEDPANGGFHPRKAVAADFNGDGRMDVIVADHGYDAPPYPGAPMMLYLSTPESTLRKAPGLEQPPGFYHSVAVGDLDRDGDPDAFVTGFLPAFLINDGKGGMTRDRSYLPRNFPLDHAGYHTSELIDVDGDGYLDLLIAGHEFEAEPALILWGSEAPGFAGSPATPLQRVADFGIIVDIDVADLDGDGINDVLLNRSGSAPGRESYDGSYLQLLQGQQDRRTFSDISESSFDNNALLGPSSIDGVWFEWLIVQDWDFDGDLDILVDDLPLKHGEGLVLINNGQGVFSPLAVPQPESTLPPPVLGRFDPASGTPGDRITLVGNNFHGAHEVQFAGASTGKFDVTSIRRIQVVVPQGARSGKIGVLTGSGLATSPEAFTVTRPSKRLFVPVLLSAAGKNDAFFTSEITLTNRGSEEATLHYTYTARSGGGSGTATGTLAPGRQRIQPDAIDYLTGLGIPIPGSGNRIGTLRVEVSGSSEVSVTTRTTTEVPEGRAGLAYPGVAVNEGFREAVYLCGLRQNSQDRSNLAVQNTAVGEEETITLRATIFSGDPEASARSLVLPERTLPPGGFYQYNGILNMAGFDNGYVKVEKVTGEAPFYAYGVINDNFNSDGSFVFPVTETSLVGTTGQTLPVIIETGNFQSELTVTNFSASEKTVNFSFVADAVDRGDDTAEFSLRLKAGEQRILPNLVGWMRREEVAGIGPANRAFVGALFATPAEGDMSGIVIGARTGAPDQRGGQYSLFYNGVPYGAASLESAWIYGLQQNEENRSNLALVNTGEIDDSSITLKITIYNGAGESEPRTRSVTLESRRWTQENGILGRISQGYVQVRKTAGNNPFVAYGVINDGGRPGERSGDGAYLPAQQ